MDIDNLLEILNQHKDHQQKLNRIKRTEMELRKKIVALIKSEESIGGLPKYIEQKEDELDGSITFKIDCAELSDASEIYECSGSYITIKCAKSISLDDDLLEAEWQSLTKEEKEIVKERTVYSLDKKKYREYMFNEDEDGELKNFIVTKDSTPTIKYS